MILLTVLTIFLVAIAIVTQLANRMTYGKILPSEKTRLLIVKARPNFWLNSLDTTIICISGGTFIAKLDIDIFCKWYIEDYGRVWRWSKASKIIDKIHSELVSKAPKAEQMIFGAVD